MRRLYIRSSIACSLHRRELLPSIAPLFIWRGFYLALNSKAMLSSRAIHNNQKDGDEFEAVILKRLPHNNVCRLHVRCPYILQLNMKQTVALLHPTIRRIIQPIFQFWRDQSVRVCPLFLGQSNPHFPPISP
jgi:hypothetical protein